MAEDWVEQSISYIPEQNISIIIEHLPQLETFTSIDEIYDALIADMPVSRGDIEAINLPSEEQEMSTVFCKSLIELDEFWEEGFESIIHDLIRRRQSLKDHPEIIEIGIEVNWIGGAAGTKLIGAGGPGGEAETLTKAPNDNGIGDALSDYTITLLDNANQPVQLDCEAPENVTVFILDTVPAPIELIRAFNDWKDTNRIIQHLCDDKSHFYKNIKRMTDIPGMKAELDKLKDLYENTDESKHKRHRLDGSTYKIKDHGFFIAGLIYSIIPGVKIYLIEVLNEFGLGTSKSIRLGLNQVQKIIKQENIDPKKAIVNCSFMLATPADLKHLEISDGSTSKILDKLVRNDDIEATLQDVRVEFKKLKELGTMSVAACGNDGEKGTDTNPKKARWPARYIEVIGVGALDSQKARAVYSNYADTPLTDGFLVFGGDASGGQSNRIKGLLGAYVSTHLDEDSIPGHIATIANNHGWVRWSGTSFATGIVSGLLACLLGDNKTTSEAMNFLRNLISEPHAGEEGGGEHLIYVRQGPLS